MATLSYERALRAHARYRVPDPSDHSLTQPANAASVRICEELPGGEDPAPALTVQPEPAPGVDISPEAGPKTVSEHDRNLKCASVTIRLSRAECTQLRKRAAEAGLTVSAYLRSCTLEAESLRAMVKDTLAQLRSAPGKQDPAAPIAGRSSWRRWLGRLWPLARASHRTAEA